MRLTKRPRVIPVLLLSDGGLYKTRRFKNPVYLGDPINTVKIFNEKGVDELCLLDIDATRKATPIDMALLKEIASEAFMPLSYGGGIRTMQEIRELFKIGFEKVVLNSAFLEDPSLVSEAAKEAGSQSIVVSIDVRKNILGKYSILNRSSHKNAGSDPIEAAKEAERLGAGEILLQSVDRDGEMSGYDGSLIEKMSSAVHIPVIACGGAGSADDLRKVIYEHGASAAAAGSLFVFYGKKRGVLINFPEERELIEKGVFR